MEFDVFIIISFYPTSTFIVFHPALHPKYVIFVILCHISLSPQILSFTHSLYATSPFLLYEVWYLEHRRALLLLSSKYKVYFHYHRYIQTTFKTIFSWFTYFFWRVIVLFVRNCWWILLFYVMSNIFSLSWIWNTQAVSQKKLQYCFLMPDILCLINTDSCGWVFLIANPPFPMSFHTWRFVVLK